MQKVVKWTLISMVFSFFLVFQGGLFVWEGDTGTAATKEKPTVGKADPHRSSFTPTSSSPSPAPETKTKPQDRRSVKVELHTVVTVGCGGAATLRRGTGPSQTSVQVYQTWAAEHSWYKTGMEGELTRVISGCQTDFDYGLFSATAVPLKNTIIKPGEKIPEEYYQNRLHSYFSSSANNPSYAQGNKARILLEWLHDVPVRGDFIMMVDPDMIFGRSFSPVQMGAAPGVPVAQVYQIELKWRTWLTEMCGEACDYFKEVSDHDAVYKYHAGPPYIFHSKDFTPFLETWKPLVDPIHRKYQRIESDMLAYVITAVKLRLPHILLEKSDWTPGPGKGALSGGCQGLMFKKEGLPSPPVLHYCSNYKVDSPSWFINKHWLRPGQLSVFHHIIDCEMPLLTPPSMESTGSTSGTDVQKDVFWSGLAMVNGINDMLVAHKKLNCPPGVRVGLEYGLTFRESQGNDAYKFAPGTDPGLNNTYQGLVGVHSLGTPDEKLLTTDIKKRNTLRETSGWSWYCDTHTTGLGCKVVTDHSGPFLVHPTEGTPVVFCKKASRSFAAKASECEDTDAVSLGHASPKPEKFMERELYHCEDQTHAVGATCKGGKLIGYVG
eukprot:TRINITY_DN19888_c0_g2_i1.p1 TRINITY_DN19888_c0_g2~~TRINITY_DN19888_c0_g2_i1.p1  ORF type:complete len:606 (+),score=82.80 TRINITY_DN19888_c0_g2_i1:55-1872(+)